MTDTPGRSSDARREWFKESVASIATRSCRQRFSALSSRSRSRHHWPGHHADTIQLAQLSPVEAYMRRDDSCAVGCSSALE
jgi:hypothetical protein